VGRKRKRGEGREVGWRRRNGGEGRKERQEGVWREQGKRNGDAINKLCMTFDHWPLTLTLTSVMLEKIMLDPWTEDSARLPHTLRQTAGGHTHFATPVSLLPQLHFPLPQCLLRPRVQKELHLFLLLLREVVAVNNVNIMCWKLTNQLLLSVTLSWGTTNWSFIGWECFEISPCLCVCKRTSYYVHVCIRNIDLDLQHGRPSKNCYALRHSTRGSDNLCEPFNAFPFIPASCTFHLWVL